MSAFVLDASVTASWFFEDEKFPATDDLLDLLHREGAVVPAIWRVELSNILLQAERRGRIPAALADESLLLLDELPILADADANRRSAVEAFSLARQFSLTSYDATYLELAIRRSLPLATLDKALVLAAKKTGVENLPN
jgi:predicted nucleic acid-binding protein